MFHEEYAALMRAHQTPSTVERLRECQVHQSKKEQKCAAILALEDQRFSRRRRFNSAFWKSKQEPRSYPPSTWPWLEAELKKFGIPAGFRIVKWGQ
jgi:hypothetical protein